MQIFIKTRKVEGAKLKTNYQYQPFLIKKNPKYEPQQDSQAYRGLPRAP